MCVKCLNLFITITINTMVDFFYQPFISGLLERLSFQTLYATAFGLQDYYYYWATLPSSAHATWRLWIGTLHLINMRPTIRKKILKLSRWSSAKMNRLPANLTNRDFKKWKFTSLGSRTTSWNRGHNIKGSGMSNGLHRHTLFCFSFCTEVRF